MTLELVEASVHRRDREVFGRKADVGVSRIDLVPDHLSFLLELSG
jgi:hypothetical protein